MHVQKQSSDVIAHQWRLESAELIGHLEILGDKMSMLFVDWHQAQTAMHRAW